MSLPTNQQPRTNRHPSDASGAVPNPNAAANSQGDRDAEFEVRSGDTVHAPHTNGDIADLLAAAPEAPDEIADDREAAKLLEQFLAGPSPPPAEARDDEETELKQAAGLVDELLSKGPEPKLPLRKRRPAKPEFIPLPEVGTAPPSKVAEENAVGTDDYEGLFDDANSESTRRQAEQLPVKSSRPWGPPSGRSVPQTARPRPPERPLVVEGFSSQETNPSTPEGPVSTVHDGPLGKMILDQLEKYPATAACQLRIEVKGGVVDVSGSAPTREQKDLVIYLCRRVPGVVRVSDNIGVATVVTKAASTAPRRKKSGGNQIDWRLPFPAWYLGVAAGLLVMVWAGYSYATRDPLKVSVYPVTGKVLLDGTAPEGANVVLFPLDKAITVRPKGFVGPDGNFQLTTYLPSDGAPRGDYKLTIEWNKPVEVAGEFVPGPNLLPEKLSKPESSTIQITVKAGKNELAPVQLTK